MDFILSTCSRLPYHNRAHSVDVVGSLRQMKKEDIITLLAWAGHDILHSGNPGPLDEYRAWEATARMAYSQGIVDYKGGLLLEEKIHGTIFGKRWKLLWKQVHIADADISAIGKSFSSYRTNAIRLFIEKCFASGKLQPSKKDFMEYWNKDQEKFNEYLTQITGNADSPFLTREAEIAFPNFARNRDMLREMILKNPEQLYGVLMREWYNFFWFPLKYSED